MKQLATVLLVDDDETANFLNARILTKMDVADEVLVVRNGAEALAALARPGRPAPTLGLRDLNMPVMGGMEFLEAYQGLPLAQQQSVRIVVLTTSMNSHELGRVEELPIAGLVSKPLTTEKVNTLLQLHFPRPAVR